MKKSLLICFLLFSFISCNNAIEKPKNLIEKEKMITILYDLSLLEAIKTQNIDGGLSSKKVNEYIYKKYVIDSIQLAQSNKYYACDIEEYKKMFEEVKNRLDQRNKKLGPKYNSPDAPQIQ